MNKKRVLNIIFYLLIIIICEVSLYMNEDIKSIIDRKIINNKKTYEKYKDLKFVTFDFKESLNTRFSLEQKDYENISVYIVNIDDKSILVELTESSVPNNKINLMKMRDNTISIDLKETYNKENDNKLDFVSGYYTNKNVKKNEDIINLKIYIGLGIVIVSLLLMFVNFFKIIRGKNN